MTATARATVTATATATARATTTRAQRARTTTRARRRRADATTTRATTATTAWEEKARKSATGRTRDGRRRAAGRARAIYNASWDGFDAGEDEAEDEAEDATAARRWAGYAGALGLNLGLGTLFCWSIYLVPLEQGLGVGRAVLSSVFSLCTVATVSAMSFAGPWVYATYSASRVAAFAAAFAGCGLWTAALAVPLRAVWPLFLGYGVMFGFASGLGYGLSVQMSPYAPLSAGLATGLVTSARAFGAFLFAPMVKAMVFSGGPQYALNTLGNYIAFSAVPIFLLFRACGLAAPLAKMRDKDNVMLDEMERDIKLAPLIRVLWVCMATGLFSGLMVMSHGATLLSSRGLSAQTLIIGGVSIVSFTTSAGRIFGGWLCDRVSPKRVLVLTPLLAVGPLMWAAMDKTSILAGKLALAAAGVVYGMFASTIPVEVRRVAGAGDFARTYGRIFTAWGLSGLAAPYVAGLFYDSYGDYSFALYVAAALSCVSALVAQLLESPRTAERERVDDETSRAQAAAKRGERFIDCTTDGLASG